MENQGLTARDYNGFVTVFRDFRVLARLLLVAFLIAVFGLAPRPHILEQAIRGADKATQVGNYPLAMQYSLVIAGFYPDRADLWRTAGYYALWANENQAAITYLDRAAQGGLRLPQDWVALGDAYRALGNLPLALDHWQAALDAGLEPAGRADVAFYDRLFEVYQTLDDYAGQIEVLRHLIRLSPHQADLYYQLGLILAAFEPEASLGVLEQAVALDSTYVEHTRRLIQDIRTASLQEEPAYTLLQSGRRLAAMEEWELALQAFLQARALQGEYAEAWAFSAEARQHMDKPASQLAYQELQQALLLNPESVIGHMFMALYWQRQGSPGQALPHLEEAISLQPDQPVFYVELGGTYALLGELQPAQAAYQKAIELAPDAPVYYRALGEFAIQYQIQVRELALPAAQQALLLAPEDADSLTLLGKIYLMLEDFEAALQVLKQAQQISPQHPSTLLNLGLAYLYLGDTQQASVLIEQARVLAPDAPVGEHAARLLSYYFP